MDVFKETSYRFWHLLFNTTLEGKSDRYSDKESSPELQIPRRGPQPGATCLPSRGQVAGIFVFKVKSNRICIKHRNGIKPDALLTCPQNVYILLSLSFLNLHLFLDRSSHWLSGGTGTDNWPHLADNSFPAFSKMEPIPDCLNAFSTIRQFCSKTPFFTTLHSSVRNQIYCLLLCGSNSGILFLPRPHHHQLQRLYKRSN